MLKWCFSLSCKILFSEPLKLNRSHLKVLKLKAEVAHKIILKKTYKILKIVHNTYFRSYSILVPEPPVKVHCHNFFIFWAMIRLVSRFLSWTLHFEIKFFKTTYKFKWTQLSPYITEKITAPNHYTVKFTQKYPQVLLKVTSSSFPSNNIFKTQYKWKNPFIFQFARRNGTSNFKRSYCENLFSEMRSVSS